MIGMPRRMLTITTLNPDRTRLPETRSIAQNRPSTVETASDATVIRTVSCTPWNRIGRNSRASERNSLIPQPSRQG
jgi:hypothetical protein